MTTKIIHSFIFILLMALTAHEAHAAVEHDTEACEVCIHVQHNDDVAVDNSQSYVIFDTALQLKCTGQSINLNQDQSLNADPIRGPPLNS